MGFFDKLRASVDHSDSLVCVGLDPRPEHLPKGDVLAFNRRIVDRTFDLVCAYKPNFAFYEALGLPGLEALRQTITDIHQRTDVPVILDAKRGDVGSTAEALAHGAFEVWGTVTEAPFCCVTPPTRAQRSSKPCPSAIEHYTKSSPNTPPHGVRPAAWAS
jgi:orotidine 5'-phosphate decarboxylase subfamily 2